LFHRFSCFILVLFEQNAYYNMMNGPVEPQVQFAIAQNQQNPRMSGLAAVSLLVLAALVGSCSTR
jgi:hypothetical protein